MTIAIVSIVVLSIFPDRVWHGRPAVSADFSGTFHCHSQQVAIYDSSIAGRPRLAFLVCSAKDSFLEYVGACETLVMSISYFLEQFEATVIIESVTAGVGLGISIYTASKCAKQSSRTRRK